MQGGSTAHPANSTHDADPVTARGTPRRVVGAAETVRASGAKREQCLTDLRTRCAGSGCCTPSRWNGRARRDRQARGEGSPRPHLGHAHLREPDGSTVPADERTRVQAKLQAVKAGRSTAPSNSGLCAAVVQGQVYAVPLNYPSVYARAGGRAAWWQTLCRRSQRRLPWGRVQGWVVTSVT